MFLIDSIKRAFGWDNEPDGAYYVYELIDTRFREPVVFYIGEGIGDRVYQHEKDTRSLLVRIARTPGAAMKLSCKHKRIVEIWDMGYEVQYAIVFRSNSRCRALQVEAQYIKQFGLERLTNETYGWSDKAIRRCFADEAANEMLVSYS